ncbi:MAG: VOC family protein [Xanthobacteraceae bacterium]|nr:VOC family protein [Xanthobacteraceae bacterium]
MNDRSTGLDVKRIAANLIATDVAVARQFYADFLGLDIVMDLGWIVTYEGGGQSFPQVSVACDGGSGTAVPMLSIEVGDADEAHRRALASGLPIEYGIVTESWGVRRFHVRDPFGNLVNILSHG